jgi:hypothetical protein
MSDISPVKNGLKGGDSKYAIKKVQANQEGLLCADYVNVLGNSIYAGKKNAEAC